MFADCTIITRKVLIVLSLSLTRAGGRACAFRLLTVAVLVLPQAQTVVDVGSYCDGNDQKDDQNEDQNSDAAT